MDSSSLVTWLLPAIAVVATAIGTFFVSRRSNSSTFLADVMKELEFYKAQLHERDKTVAVRDGEIVALNEQNRQLGRENGALLRKEHDDVLNRLEKLWDNLNQSRVGQTGTAAQLNQIHDLVNSRLTEALDKIEALETRIASYQVDRERRERDR